MEKSPRSPARAAFWRVSHPSVGCCFILLCWVIMSWNVSTEITGKMLAQTSMSGLGVLLIVNKACIHSRARVVPRIVRLQEDETWKYGKDTFLYLQKVFKCKCIHLPCVTAVKTFESTTDAAATMLNVVIVFSLASPDCFIYTWDVLKNATVILRWSSWTDFQRDNKGVGDAPGERCRLM